MQLSLENGGGYTIRGYAPGEITVALPPGETPVNPHPEDGARLDILTRSAIVTPGALIRDWTPQTFGELEAVHLELMAEMDLEVVLLGTGETLRFPQPATIAPLARVGIGVEYMDTTGACRTYNILASEGRRVAAALIML